MKRTRSRQYLERLTGWHIPCPDFRNQPFIMIEREISIEEAKRMYGFDANPDAVAVQVGYAVYAPLEIQVDPLPSIPPEVFQYHERLQEFCKMLSGASPRRKRLIHDEYLRRTKP